ncbi:uncharacterized protein EI97DRAFT_435543 [Westerdykella ornata]|uniref:Uncharacterized protein n=1 Tax=Westerdykella ornata TaxID=318751 RepID=A0A6A6JCA3_WESOR|nr:uncharacterized protein EI97DRAFT_435543 [Westerdykella ornata]KAF2273897.1 hypothetical protein EI97DRAFT_435543 [Westerdykella ornata]
MVKGLTAAISAGFRTVVVILAIVGAGLGGWALHIIDDAGIRGGTILEMSRLDEESEKKWQEFLSSIVGSNARIWVTLTANVIVVFIGTFSILSQRAKRLTVSQSILLSLDVGAKISATAALVASLSLVLIVAPFCKTIESSPPPELTATALLCYVSKGSLIQAGVSWILITTTSMITLVGIYRRLREKKSCSFEPTASALGMGGGYQAVAPALPRTTIPTIYDPAKPLPETYAKISTAPKHTSSVAASASGKRDSVISESSTVVEGEISGPLNLEKPDMVKQMRPARPWSDAPRKG